MVDLLYDLPSLSLVQTPLVPLLHSATASIAMAMRDLGRAEAWGEGYPGPVLWVSQMAPRCKIVIGFWSCI
jgi:hypothetical protein